MKRLNCILFHDIYTSDPAESGFNGSGAEHYKLPVAEFERHLCGLQQVLDSPPVLITASGTDAVTGQTPCAITVDDGGISYYTNVAARLEAMNWRGHCFVTTDRIGRPGFLAKQHIRELHARGHVIGSHSVSHPRRFSACKWIEMVDEWEWSRRTLQDILGTDVTSASIPGGYFSRRVAQAARTAGLTMLFTSEPETRIRHIDGCAVFGRFTVRNGHRSDFVMRLAQGNAAVRYREWAIWNGKKTLKHVMGAGYPQFAQWLLRFGG